MTSRSVTAHRTHAASPSRRAVTVRQATEDDLDAVVELRLALLREYGSHPIYGRLRADAPPRARRLFLAQLRADREVTLLAERHDGVIGILRCLESVGMPLLHPDRYTYVASVYVVPDERRSGVLRALFDAAVHWSKERGIDEMRLHNTADNAAANGAWEALGFEVVEHLRVKSLR